MLKLEVVAQAVRTREELVATSRRFVRATACSPPAGLTLNIPGVILDLELMSKWPALFYNTFWVQAGALVSYGTDPHAEGSRPPGSSPGSCAGSGPRICRSKAPTRSSWPST